MYLMSFFHPSLVSRGRRQAWTDEKAVVSGQLLVRAVDDGISHRRLDYRRLEVIGVMFRGMLSGTTFSGTPPKYSKALMWQRKNVC